MPCQRLPEGLILAEAAEVETLRPTILVQIRGEVVVVSGQGSVLVPSSFAGLVGFGVGGFAVPVFEILGHRFLLRGVGFAEEVQEAVGVGAGFAVEGGFEGGIAVEVLLFEGGGAHGCCVGVVEGGVV